MSFQDRLGVEVRGRILALRLHVIQIYFIHGQIQTDMDSREGCMRTEASRAHTHTCVCMYNTCVYIYIYIRFIYLLTYFYVHTYIFRKI